MRITFNRIVFTGFSIDCKVYTKNYFFANVWVSVREIIGRFQYSIYGLIFLLAVL